MERSIRIAPTLTEEQPLATFLSSPSTSIGNTKHKHWKHQAQASKITHNIHKHYRSIVRYTILNRNAGTILQTRLALLFRHTQPSARRALKVRLTIAKR